MLGRINNGGLQQAGEGLVEEGFFEFFEGGEFPLINLFSSVTR
jgi:hypothetical protein